MPALRHLDQTLDGELLAARGVLQQMGVPDSKIPFGPDQPPPRTTRQKPLVNAAWDKTREAMLAEGGPLAAQARLRSVSGPGAASFLTLPTQQDHHVEDNLFRAAVVRRLGGAVRPRDGANATCSLVSREGRCSAPLAGGVHAHLCKCGGFVVRRHDRIVQWLVEWLADGRADSEVLAEQAVPSQEFPDGRLDVTFDHEGTRVWIDVAVVTVATSNAREARRRARTDGTAARDEEVSKRSRYMGLATPFVVEAHGRPGECARAIIGKFAQDKGSGVSADMAAAWQAISAIVQSGSAELELRANGWTPAERGQAAFTFT